MKNQFVLASFDINCTWKKIAPVYRILVNNELFAERQWRWRDHYLTEVLQISAVPGTYSVEIKPVGDIVLDIKTTNHRIEVGPARWISSEQLEIQDAS
jgi:hypothetical protein